MKVAKLSKTSTLPTRKNNNDAGIDLYADLYYGSMRGNYSFIPYGESREAMIDSGTVVIVGTGITVEIPTGHFGWITNKSSSDFLVGGGIVDEGYQGELLVKVFNPLKRAILIYHGQKIAQLLILPCKILGIEEVELSEIHQEPSDRGVSGGIGRQVDTGDWNYYTNFPDDKDYHEWRRVQGDMDDFVDRNDW